ncbi:unnamed protein product, partial [Ectocarpus sp. 13 AM-2016]
GVGNGVLRTGDECANSVRRIYSGLVRCCRRGGRERSPENARYQATQSPTSDQACVVALESVQSCRHTPIGWEINRPIDRWSGMGSVQSSPDNITNVVEDREGLRLLMFLVPMRS